MANCDTTSGQVDIWLDLWVRLPFGQNFGKVALWSDVPPARDLVAKCDITSGQDDILLEGKSGASSHGNSSSLAYIEVVAVKKLVGLLYETPFTPEGNYLVT